MELGLFSFFAHAYYSLFVVGSGLLSGFCTFNAYNMIILLSLWSGRPNIVAFFYLAHIQLYVIVALVELHTGHTKGRGRPLEVIAIVTLTLTLTLLTLTP